MPTVNISEARMQLSRLVDLAQRGTDVVIARNGKPVARLTATEGEIKQPRYRLGLLEGEEGWLADDFDTALPPEILGRFEGK